MVSLTVETALGSFDFLNTSDWEEEEEEKSDRNRNGRSVMLDGLLVHAMKPKQGINFTLHIDLKRCDFFPNHFKVTHHVISQQKK